MSDDYLWDGSGTPDPEVERLERLLQPLGHDGRGPRAFAATRRGAWGRRLATWAAAAGVTLAVGAVWRAGRPATLGWDVERLAGAPQVGPARVETTARIRVGEWLETDAASRARLEVGTIGVVELEPRTRIRLLDAGQASHRLALSLGVLHARIWAPPGRFFVDTPSGTAVDLGCAYTLEVDETGAGLLTVSSGWVGFVHEGRESFVPEGARCRTRPGRGPGTPHFDDATAAFVEGLDALDFATEAATRSSGLSVVLSEARARDALSLWHLLSRGALEDRAHVFDRMLALAPPPAGVGREAVLRGEREALDRWWNALGLEDVSWWRRWERPWTPPAPHEAGR